MKIIAHRNETPGCPENSVASLEYSAKPGIYAVECDVRKTKDGQYVIYHDPSLERLIGDPTEVIDLTYADMRARLQAAGRDVITLEELIARYHAPLPILLHIKEHTPWPDFVEILKNARGKVEFIFGVQSVEMLNALKVFTEKDHLLAFMPREDMYPDFIANGIGIIRLWEEWLDRITPDEVRAAGADQVWIMSHDPVTGLDGNPTSLNRFRDLRADGALISDIVMGMAWMKEQ